MFREMIKSPYSFFLAVITLLAAQACGGMIYLVKSHAPEREIVIDGKADDWAGHLAFDEKENLSVGFLNDQKNLYVALVLGKNEAPGRGLSQGLTVWFDPAGGDKKTLGLRYPLGRPRPDRSGRKAPDEQGGTKENTTPDSGTELEVIRAGYPEKMTLEQAQEKGLEVRVDFSEESFMYELKIPLVESGSQPLAVGVNPGTTIGIGFETGKPESGENRERHQGEMGGSGRPRGGGTGGGMGGGGMRGRGGMRGGGRGGSGMEKAMPKSIKAWFEVQLLSGAGPSQVRRSRVLPF